MSMSKRIIQIIIVSTLIVVQVDSYAPVLAAPEAQGASALGRIMLRAFGKASSIATSQTNTAAGLALLAKENVSTDDLRKWRQEYPEEFRQLKMSETEWESLLEKDRAFLIPQSLQPSQQSRRFTADCATASDMRSCISALATRRIALIPVTIEGNEESIQNQAASSGQEPSLTNEINAEECLPNSVNISNVMGDIHESLIAGRDIIINIKMADVFLELHKRETPQAKREILLMYLENIRADRSRTLQDRNLAAKWYKKYAALSLEEIEALFDPCKGNEKKYRNLKRALGWFLLGGAAGATAVILWE